MLSDCAGRKCALCIKFFHKLPDLQQQGFCDEFNRLNVLRDDPAARKDAGYPHLRPVREIPFDKIPFCTIIDEGAPRPGNDSPFKVDWFRLAFGNTE